MLADGCWALFSLFGHVSPTDSLALAWRPVVVATATVAAAFWFLFVAQYTGDDEWVPSVLSRTVLVYPVLFAPLAVANPGGLLFVGRGVDAFGYISVPSLEFGPVMLLTSLYTFVLPIASFALLGRFLLRTRNLFRKQAAVIFAVHAVIVVSSMAFVAGFSPRENLDFT